MLDKIDLSKKIDKKTHKKVMPVLQDRLFDVQKASWDAEVPVVILFEGWDAAGKGTSIQKLTSPIDPRGYKLYPIRAARTYEKKYPWLWRFWLKTPARGEWAIFDRSWYGRVMVERVENLIPEKEWRRAYRDITEFERTLADDGTLIIKFFLHISKQEQKRRFEKLSKDPLSAWHVTPEDWEHHSHYDDWLVAYEEALERTDTEWGPWTIVEATDRRHTWVKIYRTVIDLLTEHFGLEFAPDSDDEEEVVLEDNSADEEEAEQEEDAFNEPSGEDSDDENPYDIDTEKLETALAANELKIEDLTNGWILEETEPEPEQEPESEPEN
jgi:polyphosphate kinase 2 (PPK2 family)